MADPSSDVAEPTMYEKGEQVIVTAEGSKFFGHVGRVVGYVPGRRGDLLVDLPGRNGPLGFFARELMAVDASLLPAGSVVATAVTPDAGSDHVCWIAQDRTRGRGRWTGTGFAGWVSDEAVDQALTAGAVVLRFGS